MYPFYLGMDLHLKRTYVVLMNAEGEVLDKQRLQNSEIANYISENVPKETYTVMEATRNWPFFCDLYLLAFCDKKESISNKTKANEGQQVQ